MQVTFRAREQGHHKNICIFIWHYLRRRRLQQQSWFPQFSAYGWNNKIPPRSFLVKEYRPMPMQIYTGIRFNLYHK
jgi:hypothetical protein